MNYKFKTGDIVMTHSFPNLVRICAIDELNFRFPYIVEFCDYLGNSKNGNKFTSAGDFYRLLNNRPEYLKQKI